MRVDVTLTVLPLLELLVEPQAVRTVPTGITTSPCQDVLVIAKRIQLILIVEDRLEQLPVQQLVEQTLIQIILRIQSLRTGV